MPACFSVAAGFPRFATPTRRLVQPQRPRRLLSVRTHGMPPHASAAVGRSNMPADAPQTPSTAMDTVGGPEDAPTRAAILRNLSEINPTMLEVIDLTGQHRSTRPESHFSITIVSEAFNGKTMLSRHKLVYKLCREQMRPGKVHSLLIDALTPSENAE